uniref:Uncharacterized protein n=1 Tax=Ditylenchus dipsaci TaxID=166011 RepID=A0A915D084_9BILA
MLIFSLLKKTVYSLQVFLLFGLAHLLLSPHLALTSDTIGRFSAINRWRYNLLAKKRNLKRKMSEEVGENGGNSKDRPMLFDGPSIPGRLIS